MNKYQLKRSAKTRVLNFFRRAFANPPMEKMIIKRINSSKPGSIWNKFVPPNYLYAQHTTRKATRENINYILDVSNVVDHFIYFGYKEKVFGTVEDEISKSKVILDIGANIGWSAMYFSSLSPGARVLAFEPHPHTFQRALKNLELNNFPNVTFYKTGFGSKPDSVKLFEVDAKNPGMNRIIPGESDFPYVTIEIDTIDNFVQANNLKGIDFIKIDVEGFEVSILRGAKNTLEQQLPRLFIELDDNNLRDNNSSAAELIGLLSSYGYKSIRRADTMAPVTKDTDFTSCHFDIIARQK